MAQSPYNIPWAIAMWEKLAPHFPSTEMQYGSVGESYWIKEKWSLVWDIKLPHTLWFRKRKDVISVNLDSYQVVINFTYQLRNCTLFLKIYWEKCLTFKVSFASPRFFRQSQLRLRARLISLNLLRLPSLTDAQYLFENLQEMSLGVPSFVEFQE